MPTSSCLIMMWPLNCTAPHHDVAMQEYSNLATMGLQMEASSRPGPLDPLYSNAVPDTSAFRYPRDTPMMGVQSNYNMLREQLAPGTYMVRAYLCFKELLGFGSPCPLNSLRLLIHGRTCMRTCFGGRAPPTRYSTHRW